MEETGTLRGSRGLARLIAASRLTWIHRIVSIVMAPSLSARSSLFWGLALAILATSAGAQQVSELRADAQAAVERVSPARFRANMAFLADDLLEGRSPGSRGHELAAKYVATRFDALELEPAGVGETYYQRVPLREVVMEPELSAFEIHEAGAAESFEWGRDYVILSSGANQESFIEAPVVFVGYGVKTPGGEFDDYREIDVRGKVVALLAGAPPSLPAALRAHVSSRSEKARTARDHGAVGAILLRTPDATKILPWERVAAGAELPAMRWMGPEGRANEAFPEIRAVAAVSQAVTERLFRNSARSWGELLQEAQETSPGGFLLPVTVRLRAVSRHREISSPNVAAVLRGSEPGLRDEYVVFTAHSDHLGIGPAVGDDDIFNGAADNASGVAALLELAYMFRSLSAPPARSVLFLAVTAEEKGLLGSDYFVHFPTVPIEKIVANINIDNAGVTWPPFRDVVARGGEHSTLGQTARREAARLNLGLTPDPAPEQLLFIRSDQYSFVRKGIPALWILPGGRAQDQAIDIEAHLGRWIAERYHSPSDDMTQPLSIESATLLVQLHFLVGYGIAQDPNRPTWLPGDVFGELFAQE